MQIAITGLPRSGKTTLFNALTGSSVAVGDYAGRTSPNIAVARVPDARLDRLAEMFEPRPPVYAEVTYVDLPGPAPGAPEESLFSGEALNLVQQADAVLHVVRAFDDDAVPHPKGGVDWRRDVRDVGFDLLFADIALIDRRIERVEAETKGLRASEREARVRDIEALKRVQQGLEAGKPLRDLSLNETDNRVLQDTFLVSALPYLVALNVAEADLAETGRMERELAEEVAGPRTGSAVICAGLEGELGQMEAGEEAEFRVSLGAGEPGRDRMIALSYRVLGLISFLTIGDREVRAWSVPEDTPAAQAAGTIHSDMERGFIRAEVIGFDDLVQAGGMQEARNSGLLRTEGRDYAVRDGDVVKILFSV